MEEKKFSDRLKRTHGCIWWLFGFMCLVCLFLLLGGILIIAAVDGDVIAGGIICIVLGFLGLALFLGIGILLPYIQWKKGFTQEIALQWPSGTLTDDIIKKDIMKRQKTRIIGGFGATALLLAILVPMALLSDEVSMLGILSFICTGVVFIWAIYELIITKSKTNYYIDEDRIVDAGIDKTFDVIDAVTNHMPTHTPKFLFEKYGEYDIDCTQIHSYYMPQALVEILEIGEEVYLVKSKKTNKILHIYRKKYWDR